MSAPCQRCLAETTQMSKRTLSTNNDNDKTDIEEEDDDTDIKDELDHCGSTETILDHRSPATFDSKDLMSVIECLLSLEPSGATARPTGFDHPFVLALRSVYQLHGLAFY
jgi:hypothetical protein